MDGVQLIIAGQVVPNSEVVLSGRYMTVNEKITSELDWAMDMALPEENTGTLDMISTWFGTANATFGVDLMPTIGICHDDFGCFDTTFTYTWALASDSVEVVTADREYKHDLPSIALANQPVDFGDVPVAGQQSDELEAVEELRITNAGNGTLLLQDVALLEDLVVFDVGSVSLPSVAVGAELVLELTFNPTEPNAYEDTLVIETNDPVQDVFEIPLYGAGVSGR